MRIAMVNHGYRPIPPEPADSPGLVIDQLATALTRRGVDVVTISGGRSHRATPYRRLELNAPRRSGRHAALAEVLFAMHVRKSIRGIQPDLIHHHASAPAALGIRPTGVPVLMTYAAPVSRSGRIPTSGLLSGLSKTLEHLACRRVDHVSVPSSLVRGFINTHYGVPAGRLSTIPNGVDVAFFSPSHEEPVDETLVCVARISPYKDQAAILKALAQPDLVDRRVRLLLVGPEEDSAYADGLRRLAIALRVEDRVEFYGPVAFQKLPDIYRSASVIVAPSRAEAMPLALLEAMSCGRAVVASAIPQHEALGRDAGIIFAEAGNPRSFSAGIASLLSDPARRLQAGRAARRAVAEQYSWDAVAAMYERLYLDLTAGSAGNHSARKD